VALKGAFSVNSVDEMKEIMTKFEDSPEFYTQTCDICQQYVAQNAGAAEIIYKTIDLKPET
jgi:hypothetical protein